MINNNINFKGYKNVFCAYDIPVSANKSATFISMQLNDEDGHNDLSEYRKIKGMQGDVVNQKYGDVLTLSYLVDKNNKTEHLYFDSKDMYFGDELLILEEKFVPKEMSEEQYKKEKAIHMKAYTLMASLTDRMKTASSCIENKEERTKVIERMFNSLWGILQKQDDAYRVTNSAFLKKVKFQDLAALFNTGVNKTMEQFFNPEASKKMTSFLK